MASAHPGEYRGPCGRGIFALRDWTTPLKRPEHLRLAKVVNDGPVWKVGQQLMMKYNYQGNADSPLGKELTVACKTPVKYVSRHDEHWINVRTQEGDEGYVPFSYVMVDPEQLNSLPWLEGKKEALVQQEAAEFKPYRSAYAPKGNENSSAQDASQYYCSICEKQLNGPIPYKVHLNSKAHKEEVEVHAS
ncbi:uncharacterized protein LOC128245569 [Mya arenaria]|uniref:uncharacterized protein LOC128245569 n=1 Tax=Mya arenaria TaxID=6604 RepID=UPI0022DFBA14|nr:uncharacterized protein LOC128245569 [Mya arenaria]XP_052819725.1 uncharacterized protein LOC128245569 [Mya arenaria]